MAVPFAAMEQVRASTTENQEAVAALLTSLIRKGAELLPAQGPITAFVFLNTLQGLEDLPFEQGIQRGARLFGCHPYLAEDRYREMLSRGRIRPRDVANCVRDDLGPRADERVCGLTTLFELRQTMLLHPLRSGPPEELQWFVAETDALTRLGTQVPDDVRSRFLDETRHWALRDLRNGRSSGAPDSAVPQFQDLVEKFGAEQIEAWSADVWENFSLQALWRVCRKGAAHGPTAAPLDLPVRHRDLVRLAGAPDPDALVHEILIRFCAAFTDQGFARWALPYREQGFLRAFAELYRRPTLTDDAWRNGLCDELVRHLEQGITPLESIRESLAAFGVQPDDWDDFISAKLLALRGWAGMLWQMEDRGDRVAMPVAAGTLTEYLAVRLLLDRWALAHVARTHLQYTGPLAELRAWLEARLSAQHLPRVEERAFLLFQVAEILGWSAPRLLELPAADWEQLIREVEAFSSRERRRLMHRAFEHRLHTRALDAFAIRAARPPISPQPPRFQASFCIDTREESFRRHIEETDPAVETFGAAGFFAVAMYYRGVSDAHYAALCPIVVRPQHWVVEEVVYNLEESHRERAQRRKVLAKATKGVHVGTRNFLGGALLTAGFGVLASIPLVARVLFPRLTAHVRELASRLVEPPRVTRLHLERTAVAKGPEGDGIGYTVEEMANAGERILREMGPAHGFARLFFFFGHGSFCLNNPHKSTYDCGACSGSAGGPNARALAMMLNDARVRKLLAARGLVIPDETYFIGGLHNTCDDTLTFHDLDLLPLSHRADFEYARGVLRKACEKNAHERCRRFFSAPLNLSFEAAHAHVEERSQDLAQTRPEFGNASNAITFVGRRSRIRGLYLDRRCFLVSYNSTQDDDEATILGRILGAVVIVCSGINLQYFFSYVDPRGYGAGSKLPHNITSLLGVMDGTASDLRSGLPWQGVEIHEPVRLAYIIEARPAALDKIMARNPIVARILRNGWVQLALLAPDSDQLLLFKDGQYVPYQPTTNELPTAPTSTDWYRGWRDHLDFALIQPAS